MKAGCVSWCKLRHFSSLPWNILFHLALQGSEQELISLQKSTWIFNSSYLLFCCLLNKWSIHYFQGVIKPFQVRCCITSETERAWKWCSVTLEIIYQPLISDSKLHWKQQKPLQIIVFFSDITELNFENHGRLVLQFLNPLSQISPNFRYHRPWDKLQYNCVFFLNSTYAHVNYFNDCIFNTLAQPNIRVQTCDVPWVTFVKWIGTESWQLMWFLLELLET